MSRPEPLPFHERGWLRVPGRVPAPACAAARAAWCAEVRHHPGPLLRQLDSRAAPHVRSAGGLVVNPVINPHHWPGPFPRFRRLAHDLLTAAPLADLAATLLDGPPALLQVVYGESHRGVDWHVDVHPVRPGAPILGVLVALHGIDTDAGRTRLLSRSHHLLRRGGPRVDRWRRVAARVWAEQFLHRRRPDPTLLAEARAAVDDLRRAWSLDEAVPVLTTGDVLAWDGAVLHRGTPPSRSDLPRHVVILHFVRQSDVAAHLA